MCTPVKTVSVILALSIVVLSLATFAFAEPKDDVAEAASTWAKIIPILL